jgi:hypothetical protein
MTQEACLASDQGQSRAQLISRFTTIRKWLYWKCRITTVNKKIGAMAFANPC